MGQRSTSNLSPVKLSYTDVRTAINVQQPQRKVRQHWENSCQGQGQTLQFFKPDKIKAKQSIINNA